jgi:hypothetical protein
MVNFNYLIINQILKFFSPKTNCPDDTLSKSRADYADSADKSFSLGADLNALYSLNFLIVWT